MFSCVQREQSERAHAAAEVIAAKHEVAAWQAKLQHQAADMAACAQHSAPGQVTPTQKRLHLYHALVVHVITERAIASHNCMEEAPLLMKTMLRFSVALTDITVLVDSRQGERYLRGTAL